MKRRAMKKCIPSGMYCYSYLNGERKVCKWYVQLGTKKLNSANCEFSSECKESCVNDDTHRCTISVIRCKYLKYTDYNEESLLWDHCKECGVKDN